MLDYHPKASDINVNTLELESPLPEIQSHTSNRQKSRNSFLQWFYNLSINRKSQLIPLVNLLVLGGIVGVGAVLIITEGRTQLLKQSKAELSLTDVNYNIKLNQMELGFRGEARNPIVIAAAKAAAQGKPVPPSLKNQLRQTFQAETEARNIEYATLVGPDLRIIANANRDRQGEIFNPGGLVRQVFLTSQQIKTSAIANGAELKKESPTLLPGIAKQDALIRYVVTPVLDLSTGQVIGALVAGDIVNGKLPIVDETQNALAGGYSAVYLRKSAKDFDLAIALDIVQGRPQLNVGLPDASLLEAADRARGLSITKRMDVNGQTYTLAAKAVLDAYGEPIAILVRGTPETELNNLLKDNLSIQLLLSALGLGAIVFLATVLRQAIAKPVQQLQQATQEFSGGDRQVRAEVMSTDEIGKLATTFNQMADSILLSEEFLKEQTRRKERYSYQEKLYADIASYGINQSQDVEPVFHQAVTGAREILNADRVVVYLFKANWSGYIAAESVLPDWSCSLGDKIEDPCISSQLIEAYRKGRIVPTNNVFEAGFDPQHLKLMERLQIKATLVTPILKNEQLFGLLIAHHCSAPHDWQQHEISFLAQLATQVGLLLDRVSLLEQKSAETERLQMLREITVKIGRCTSFEDTVNITVEEARQALNADRVVIYGLTDKWLKTIVAESVVPGWPLAMNSQIDDPCFHQQYAERYRAGRVKATDNIYNAGLTECHIKQLEAFAVKANLVAPIMRGGELLGLLIAHQCSGPRTWQQSEIDLFTQIATQMGYALDLAALIEQQKVAKEQLQQRALELLMEVEPVSQGDLTIRASVTDDEIGTVADSYNVTVGSLRKIVTQVQAVARAVAATTSNNEASVAELSAETLRQAEEIDMALTQIQQMSDSIRAVAANAKQAEAVVRQANQTVAAGDIAMNRTVEGIVTIRETIAQTAKKVKRLGESSQKISKVVNLIGSFADKTNLLALNAAIEAANAGEQGRGFAVVADQVRALARQSAAATVEIEALVADIQAETNEVVAAMEAGTEQVVTGTKLVDETRNSLNKITAASTQIGALVEAIAQAAVVQSQSSETVTQTITGVAAIANKNSTEATIVSASFEELLAVAQQLQASVGQFKVM
ncbi:MAG: GAF domain-containing protein [Chroococcidiopsidaceae cyanobacterium CP_BM_ER_R8_30]|nr:GAF domain-containing protein [Chroococcidiopsidaceae cyanobacterium CP_BM_ER_R8_30]